MRALVVGASGGLGAAFLSQLNADPRILHIDAWSRSPIDISGQKIAVAHVDLTEETTIALAARELRDIDLAIVATGILHSANVQPEKTWRSLDPAVMRLAFEINTIGPALVAKHVLPKLAKNRRAVFAALSARVGSISDNHLGGWHSYRASKAALNQIVRCLSVELAVTHPQAICVAVHPGTVDTALSRPFHKRVGERQVFTPAESARHLLSVLDGLAGSQSGHIFDWAGAEIAP
jgi:NAD(P)-dependent dehydrogenase (short-subunit alcohol dehydrogenase family)